jgi:uncharacterized protein YoaH (UPF0181 family)
MATPLDRIERIARETATSTPVTNDPYFGAQRKDVTVNGVTYKDAIDIGSAKPPAATQVGMVSPISGLTITGTERNMAKEREAMDIGYTKEYIASRGGINSQGYFNDTPISGQLTASEQRQVTKPDGTVDTAAMARILQDKQIAELVSQGFSRQEATRRVASQYGEFGIGTTSAFGTGRTLARDTFKKTISSFFGESEAAKPWVEELYNAVSKLYLGGSSAEEAFNIALLDARNNPNLKTFTDRFKGIYALQDMKQAGKPVKVPTIAEYVVSQAAMGDLLNQAQLGDIATDEFTTELISKGNAVSTVANKINQVYNRIDLAPKDIKDTFSRFFPTVDRPTLARTILLGEKGTRELVDELGKLEVLAAAEKQGIAATPERLGGLTAERAAEYARMGETYSSIMPKLQRVAQATPITSKLAGISRRADIGQAGIESAVIKGTAAELEELQRLSEEEEARYRARAGRAETGLASQQRALRSGF